MHPYQNSTDAKLFYGYPPKTRSFFYLFRHNFSLFFSCSYATLATFHRVFETFHTLNKTKGESL